MALIYNIFLVSLFLLFIVLVAFIIKHLLFRRGKAYLYTNNAENNIVEIYLAQVRTVTGSSNYKIYDTSGKGNHYVGEVTVTAGNGIVRLVPADSNNQGVGVLNDIGEVDEAGNIYLYENQQKKLIGHCNPEGKRKFRDLWLLKHTEVELEGGQGNYYGRCTESLRFKKRKPGEITLLARAAAVLLLYRPDLTDKNDEPRFPAKIPLGHLALPAAIIYSFLFVFTNPLFEFHDIFPRIGHILSYTAAMILFYFGLLALLRFLTTDLLMKGKSFGDILAMSNRTTGIKGWDIAVMIFLCIAFVLSVLSKGYELLPLWLVMLIGITWNKVTYHLPQWHIFKPGDGYLNFQFTAVPDAIDPGDQDPRNYHWEFESISAGKTIKTDHTLIFSKKYIQDKRRQNPFGSDNATAVKDLFKSAKEVAKKSPDPFGDRLIEQILQKVKDVARAENLSRYDIMQMILSFCQKPNFGWIMDGNCSEINNGGTIDDYFRFPIETMYDKRGDCDCTAMMGFLLFKKAGIPSAYLLMVHDGGGKHAAIGIGDVPETIAGAQEGIIEIKGKKYYFCETVGEGWQVGVLPANYQQSLQMFEQKLATHPEMAIVSDEV